MHKNGNYYTVCSETIILKVLSNRNVQHKPEIAVIKEEMNIFLQPID